MKKALNTAGLYCSKHIAFEPYHNAAFTHSQNDQANINFRLLTLKRQYLDIQKISANIVNRDFTQNTTNKLSYCGMQISLRTSIWS